MKQDATYIEHLSKDKRLAVLLNQQEPIALKKKKNICLRLCASIMSQQLSVKVAEVIFKRFLELYDGNEPTPQQILDTPFEILRGIGLSNAKANYVRNVAEYAIAHGMDDKKLYKMSNEEVLEFLLPIKGVGRWTVEMLLMFTLGREDVFAPEDLGIQQAMIKIYKLDATDKKALREKMLKLSAKWSPYRTYACLHLWRYKDTPAATQ
ncbi:MAG: DNA-3-methyladenine glycosylase 2 family protein [Sphingobacteriales bacterium]|nr:MAG: DNA-3-methyladenine glycosylase 2 family protein [Sphingobacteriales bacterium]